MFSSFLSLQESERNCLYDKVEQLECFICSLHSNPDAMHSSLMVHQAQRGEYQADGADDVVFDTGPTRQVSERQKFTWNP